MTDPKATPIINAIGEVTPMLATIKERSEQRRKDFAERSARTNALIDSLDEQFKVMNAFIARMVSEYKALLVDYVSRCQNYISEFGSDADTDGHARNADKFWRAELVEAMRRLELGDAELLPLINPIEPYRLTQK